MDTAKVATVEDYDSVVQESVPASRREAFRKRASGLASVTNSSDTGTVDSGYSSNSTPNALGEIFPESPTEPSGHSDVSTTEPTPSRPALVTQPSSSQDGRKSRAGNSHRISGSYSYTAATLQNRPVSRAASKSTRDGRSSPALRCPPIKTGNDECDCKDCNSGSANEPRPSPMLSSTSAGLESPWTLDLKNGLPYMPPGNSWSSTPLSNSPANAHRGGSKNNGFPFETFTTPSASAASNGLGSTRPQSFMSSSNPLAAWNYEYTASPSAYTPVNPLHSPPPYLGSGGTSSSWIPPMPGLGNPDLGEEYNNYSHDYLYGPPSGATSASNGLDRQYSLPPRSASVQPISGSSRRQRSSSYAVRPEIPDFSSMAPPAPPNRRSSSRVPPSKRLHSATNSYDARYEAAAPYDTTYDAPYEPTYEEMYGPPPPTPISRRLSRSSTSGPGYLPDIARATSVPPVDNYITSLDRARRITSMTPQPLAIQQRERARRGSNSSSGLSINRRTHDREAHLDNLAEQVIVEKRPELALTKRISGSVPSHPEFEYPPDGYDGYTGYEDYGNQDYGPYDTTYDTTGMDHGHHEGEMILRGDYDSDALRFSSGVPPLPYAEDLYQRPIRMNPERRKSIHRRATDFPPSREPYLYGAEIDQLRSGAESRGSGSERRSRRYNEYDQEAYL